MNIHQEPAKSKLDYALEWAARGFRVFPLLPGKNTPYGGSDWTESATGDAEKIRRMWTDPVIGGPLDHNIGVLTNEMIVVDVDSPSQGSNHRLSAGEL